MLKLFKQSEEPIRATADVEIRAASGDADVKVRIVAYRDRQEMSVPQFGNIAVKLSGMELPSSIPLLTDHENKISAVAGSGQPRIEDGQLVIEGTLARHSEAGKAILSLHRSGVRLEASIGAVPTSKHRIIEAGESFDGIVATNRVTYFPQTRLKETSLVAIGAADGTSVSISAKGGSKNMDQQATPEVDHEHDRIVQITKNDRETYLKAMAEGWTAQQTAEYQLEQEKANRPKPSLVRSSGDAPDSEAFEAAVMLHASGENQAIKCYGERVVEAARPLRRSHIMDYLKLGIELGGGVVPSSASKEEVIRAALTGKSAGSIQASSSFSTLSITNVLDNVANKSLQAYYKDAKASYESFVTRRTNANFKEARAYRPQYDDDGLMPLAPTGEIKHTTVWEKSVGTKLETFARIISVSRHDLINDDINFLADMPQMLGRLAKRKTSQVVWSAILSNADYDGATFFHADNSNLLTGAGNALSVEAIGNAVEAMRVQSQGGEPLDIRPHVLVVSPKLEQLARQLLSSTELARDVSSSDNLGTGNPLPALELQVEPRLSTYAGSNDDDWYIFAKPGEGSVYFVELDGANGPAFDTAKTDFNTLGMQWRCYYDFGAWLGDPLTAIKSEPGS